MDLHRNDLICNVQVYLLECCYSAMIFAVGFLFLSSSRVRAVEAVISSSITVGCLHYTPIGVTVFRTLQDALYIRLPFFLFLSDNLQLVLQVKV